MTAIGCGGEKDTVLIVKQGYGHKHDVVLWGSKSPITPKNYI